MFSNLWYKIGSVLKNVVSATRGSRVKVQWNESVPTLNPTEEGSNLMVVCETPDNSCNVALDNRINCGDYDQSSCIHRGCCYDAKTAICYFNSKSSPFYSLRTKSPRFSKYVGDAESNFYEKPKMPCEICPPSKDWKGYNVDGRTICHLQPSQEGKRYQLILQSRRINRYRVNRYACIVGLYRHCFKIMFEKTPV